VDSARVDSVKKILINLERMKWMPPHPEGRLIVVNIPEFRMHVTEQGKKVFDMKVVVGKEGHSTILFSGNMDRVVFNPYWNLPSGIVKKEVVPAMEKDTDYLEKNEMEITGESGGWPVVRQLPGKKNELGRMKFLFPNSFNIYFHDTPHKELFSKTQRAYSHGCIRLAAPRKLADYVLESMPEWTRDRVDSLLATGQEQTVKLRAPVPVLICYFTAWVSGDGVLVYRKDIYGHDSAMARKLFLQ
jgi:murein L,D-transpeptidase YcbB/YkuD